VSVAIQHVMLHHKQHIKQDAKQTKSKLCRISLDGIPVICNILLHNNIIDTSEQLSVYTSVRARCFIHRWISLVNQSDPPMNAIKQHCGQTGNTCSCLHVLCASYSWLSVARDPQNR